MNKEIKQRLKWIELHEETNNAGLVCLRCGISRPTLRKWYKRYKEKGLDGLQDVSRRPHSSPNTKIDNRIEDLILKLGKDRKLGARRIQNELLRDTNRFYHHLFVHVFGRYRPVGRLCSTRSKNRKINHSRNFCSLHVDATCIEVSYF